MAGRKKSISSLDILSLLIVIAGGTTLLWMGLLKEGRASEELRDCDRVIAELQKELASEKLNFSDQQALVSDRERKVRASGRLPMQSFDDRNLEEVDALAAQSGVRITRVMPVSPVLYPGIRENRFQLDTQGPLESIVGFLDAIQSSHLWADISYLTITPAKTAGVDEDKVSASLTLCFFSSTEEHGTKAERPVAP